MKRAISIFFRNIKNNPRLFTINLVGFSIGVLTALFIYIFTFKELSADRFHINHNDIYRVVHSSNSDDLMMSHEFLPTGELLKNTFTEINDYIRISEWENYTAITFIGEFINQKVWFVDQSFFELLDFQLELGDYKQLYKIPNGIILSKELANRYFAGKNPIGENIDLFEYQQQEQKTYIVVGVLKDYPEESTLNPQIISNIEIVEKKFKKMRWNMFATWLFLHIPDCQNSNQISSKIAWSIADERNKDAVGYHINGDLTNYELQPLNDLYLHSSDVNDNLPKGDYKLVMILTLIGLITLIVTTLNYNILNLGTISKNKGYSQIHKVLGGNSTSLLKKLIGDSLLFSFTVYTVVMSIYPFAHKIVTQVSGFRYSLFAGTDIIIISSFLLILLLFGIFNGLIQHFFISKFLHSNFIRDLKFKKQYFFNGLIQFQLTIFIVFIICLFFINYQVNFIRNSDIGFDVKNTVSLLVDENDVEIFKQKFKKLSYVKNISTGEILYKNQFIKNEATIKESNKTIESQFIWGDHNFIDTYDIKLLIGRNPSEKNTLSFKDFMSRDWDSKKGNELLVNESFVKAAGLENPIGTYINGIMSGQIVGIIENVKNLPIYYPIKPMVIGCSKSYYISNLIVSINEGYHKLFMEEVKNFYEKRNLNTFLDQFIWRFDFEKIYKKEQTLCRLINVFSIIILVIMILGLIGLSLYISESKTKEIGIRKVNGAKVMEVLFLLNKSFISWIVFAFIIAVPISWVIMHKWLENFAYKINLSWWVFALAGLLALGIALLTVSWQSWRAATRNPVEALRYE